MVVHTHTHFLLCVIRHTTIQFKSVRWKRLCETLPVGQSHSWSLVDSHPDLIDLNTDGQLAMETDNILPILQVPYHLRARDGMSLVCGSIVP